MTSVLTDPMAAHLAPIIDRWGWAVVAVGTGHCDEVGCGVGWDDPYSYTVGLHAVRLPELIVRGLDGPTAQRVLNDAARCLIDDQVPGRRAHLTAGGTSWIVTPGSAADRSDVRYARVFARESGRRLAAPLRLERAE